MQGKVNSVWQFAYEIVNLREWRIHDPAFSRHQPESGPLMRERNGLMSPIRTAVVICMNMAHCARLETLVSRSLNYSIELA